MQYWPPINGRASRRVRSSRADSIMILHIGRIILIVIEVVVLFNLLIVVHELGHFLAARWRGLYVEKFGVWFGKPLWKKTINGVQYSLGSLPFGGFVALPQLAPMDIIEGKADLDRAKLPKISALDKIIVAFAGPLFSFGLAVLFAVIIWMVGRPVSESEATTTIGYVIPDSPAAEAELKAGDKILSVDGKPVSRFGGMGEDSISWRVVRSEGEKIPIGIERNVNGRAEIKTVEAKPTIPETKPWMRKGFREIGIVPAETPMIAKVEPGSPATKAGLRPNDLILTINDQRIYHIFGIADFIRDHLDEPLTLGVERGGTKLALPFRPGNPTVDEVVADGPAARAGLQKGDVVVAVDGQPAKSTLAVSDYVKNHAGMLSIFNTVGAIASPKSDVKLQHMSGPVMMLRVYYVMFENKEGWRMALWFSVVLNVNLALLNLLPIPVLDGGHIVLALVEAVRRRPVNMRVLEVVQTACAVLIIGFMVYIAFFDVQDLFGTKRDTPKFLPKATPAKSTQP